MNPNNILIELTGPLERAAGCSQVQLPCDSPLSLRTIFIQLLAEYPATGSVLGNVERHSSPEGYFPPGLLVICDSFAIKAGPDTLVDPGHRITLMSMISGG
jgi:hypothetical protein